MSEDCHKSNNGGVMQTEDAPDQPKFEDNYSEAAAFAGITFSQACQFDFYMEYLLGRGPKPGFLAGKIEPEPKSEPVADVGGALPGLDVQEFLTEACEIFNNESAMMLRLKRRVHSSNAGGIDTIVRIAERLCRERQLFAALRENAELRRKLATPGETAECACDCHAHAETLGCIECQAFHEAESTPPEATQ